MPSQSSNQSAATSDLASLSYEQALSELEQIVAAMDSDQLPLDDMITKYDRGTQLLAVCQQRLQAAQHKVELIQSGKQGTGEVVPVAGNATPAELTAAVEAAGAAPSLSKARRSPRANDSTDDKQTSLF
jgi:exodeoxyribonuclease VII small subunit